MPIDKLSPNQVTGSENQNKSADGHQINLPGNVFPTEDAANQECEGIPEIMVGPCSASKRVQRNGRSKKRSGLKTTTRLIQIVLSGVIGLAAGGFVLFLVNPEHPLIESISNMVHGKQATEEVDPSQSKDDPPASPKETPSPVGNVTSDPTTPEPISTETLPKETKLALRPQVVPQPTTTDQDDEQIIEPKPALPLEEHETLVLDFSKPRIRVVLSEVDDKSDVAIIITDVVGLNTPYELKSKQELVRRGEPVDIVFPEHANTRMRVTIHKKQGKSILEVTPELLLTKNKWVDLTQDRLKGLYSIQQKEKQKWDYKLAEAKKLVQILEQSSKSASSQAASSQRQQLKLLKQNAIPQLEQQIKAIGQRITALQRLSQLLEQIDGKAELHYTALP